MFKYKDIQNYIFDIFDTVFGEQAVDFGFSADKNKRYIFERQNISPLPSETTVLTYRIDNFDNWRAQRYGRSSRYNEDGYEEIIELKTFRLRVNILSKELGSAFDAMRFFIANLQNERYNNMERRLLGIENISKMLNLTALENSTWSERIQVDVQMNFIDVITNDDLGSFTRIPVDVEDVTNSVKTNIDIKE